MKAIFTHYLNQKILPGLVALGRYTEDGVGLAAATPSDKIFIYDLDKLGHRSGADSNPRVLNMSQPITSIAAARLGDDVLDTLLVCVKTGIFAYDVERNADVFAREVADGANAVITGALGGEQLVIVGGNCSVEGYDRRGSDAYWIVTGDNVRSMALVDVDNDDENELLVGSDDYDIRVFKNDDLVHEITETQIVTHLYSLGNGSFAYALANGTVGVYEKLNRIWRVKSKNRATFILSYDINGDGTPELITGWQGGKVDGRNVKTGEVLFKDNFDQTVAGMCEGDCRGTGSDDLVVVSITGEIRCYNPRATKPLETRTNEAIREEEAETVRELFARKQALALELKKYEYNTRYPGKETDPEDRDGAIPAKTRLQTSLGISFGSAANRVPHVEINLSTNNDTVIRAVIIFAEGIFKDETHVKHPAKHAATGKLTISLYPPRDVPIDIHIKAFIGYRDSTRYHVFELTRQLPRFSMYAYVDKPPSGEIASNVVFFVNERMQRVLLWINRNFLLSKALDSNTRSELSLHFLSLRDGGELAFAMDPAGKVTLATENIALAGDLIQSLATYLNLERLKSVAHYPKEEEKCVACLEKLRELEIVKRRLNVDLSNKSNLVRSLIVRAEDARLLHDLKLMKHFYARLRDLNEELRSDYEIRATNYNDVVAAVKEINGIVQKASRLRFGRSDTDPISLAKNAIATNNSAALVKVIRTGET